MADVLCAECDRPVGDRLTLCTVCGDRLVAELLAVPGLVVELTITRARLDKRQRQQDGGKSAEVPLPIRLDGRGQLPGDRAYFALENAITTWARVVLDANGAEFPIAAAGLARLVLNNRGLTRDRAAVPIMAVTMIERAAVWLACHPNELRGHEAAGEMLDEITNAVAGLRYVIDLPPELRPLGPCPAELDDGSRCGYELRAEREAAWVRCRRCRSQHDVRELQRKAANGIENQLYALPQLLRILAAIGEPVPKTTLYRWARERRIQPRGWQHGERITDHQISEDDRQVYRLGDARALACRDENQGGSAA